MKTIIAGSRQIFNITLIFKIIETCPWEITEVISGDGGAVDFVGAYWGYINNIKVRHFPAQWQYLGKRAGPARNQVMIDHAEALIYVWNGVSRGTRDVISRACRSSYLVHPESLNKLPRAYYDLKL